MLLSEVHTSLFDILHGHGITVVLDKKVVKRANMCKSRAIRWKTRKTEFHGAIALRSLMRHVGKRVHLAIRERRIGGRATLPKNGVDEITRADTGARLTGLGHQVTLYFASLGCKVDASDGEEDTAAETDDELASEQYNCRGKIRV